MKLLPYGISDFRQLRTEGLYYVDKTMFLPIMEKTSHFLFLIRPRRFGKSVFLSMMRHYYDINERDNFASLFEGLWIADNPTQYRGQFQVLHLDFSRIGGDMDNLEANFDTYCSIALNNFAKKYESYYFEGFADKVEGYANARAKMNYIDFQAKEKDYPLYLIIDEYDNFTNTVLNEKGERVYWALTHAYGFYRDVFKLFKGMFARILMMGVSPVTLDDLTSGYNIATNISFNEDFNLMLGFSETDVRQMIRYYQGFGVLKRDEEELIA
ncbi:MAG: AAA family ATPase, partial [Bacteroidales bacterium]|nr:AAA family ATPase [Bacteroidales bacterium]